jgi:hypothetical protein
MGLAAQPNTAKKAASVTFATRRNTAKKVSSETDGDCLTMVQAPV